eukprot:gene3963-14044_t
MQMINQKSACLLPQRHAPPRSANLGAHLPVRGASISMRRVNLQQTSVAQESGSTYSRDMTSAPRLIQHKSEAFWFYRFLSIVYDHVVNPGHWTEDMREDALSVAKLDSPDLKVCDVGGGTGFTTLGILAKAKAKPALNGCTVVEGDAEDLPFKTDEFDRYVSAGSIEYWPEPQRGITEAYRVIKEGGTACLIGPVYPTFWLSRFFADVWMLFPKESEYMEWFTKAGFTNVEIKRIGPKWYRGVRRHGLIMGCSVTGTKPKAGETPLDMPPKAEESGKLSTNPLSFLLRLILGTSAGFYYFIVPVYMYLKNLVVPAGKEL